MEHHGRQKISKPHLLDMLRKTQTRNSKMYNNYFDTEIIIPFNLQITKK